jgi:GDP-L-fucose synthase
VRRPEPDDPLGGSLDGERVLVTGSGGVLGTALCDRLTALVDSGVDCAPRFLRRADCDLLRAADVDAVWESFRPTIVFHLAGWVAGIQGNLDFGGQAFYENVTMNVNVIEASRRSGVRKVVAAGSTAVYPDGIALPMREDDLWYGPPHASEAPYGHAKRAMLAQLAAYERQYGMAYAYLICTNLYGPDDRFDEQHGHVVPSLVKLFHDARCAGVDRVVVWGDGSPTRDLLFADDAARGFLAAALRGDGPMNLATGAVVTIRELVELVKQACGYEGAVTWDPTRPTGQLARGYDVRRMRALGWGPAVSLRDGVQTTCDWYARNRERARH